MKKLLVVLFALVIGISFTSTAWSAATPPKEVKLEAKMGVVTLKHEEHAVARKIDCKTCHHKGTEGDVKCGSCHKAEAKDKTVALKDAFHNTCKKCHEEKVKAGAKAPTKCNECHVKAS